MRSKNIEAPLVRVGNKLRFLGVMSTAWMIMLAGVMALTSAPRAAAHEVMPTIADLTVVEGRAQLELRLNLEAFLTGIDLDDVTDTDDAPQAAAYDALRAQPQEAVEAQLPDLLSSWNALPLLAGDQEAITLTLDGLEMVAPPDAEQPRQSLLRLSGPAEGLRNITMAWPTGAGALVLRQQGVADPFTGYVESGSTSGPIQVGGGDAPTAWQAFVTYIPVGFDHIVPQGLDHILFVLGLFLLSTSLGPLIWQISAFTLAHTVTLAMGALGIVNIPGSIVEPLIAASIVYVAVENIFFRRMGAWRPAVIFGFGLLHGLGFASVLGDFGLPAGQFVPALMGFNVGVEVGQLVVVAVAAVLVWLAVQVCRMAPYSGDEVFLQDHVVMFRGVSVTGSLTIALIGAWWVVQRTLL